MLSAEQREKVKKVIGQVSEREGIGRREARELLHKYVCGGKCGWYKTRSREVGFDRLSVTTRQKRLMEEVIGKVMRDVTLKKAKAQIHEVLCPGHPRPIE